MRLFSLLLLLACLGCNGTRSASGAERSEPVAADSPDQAAGDAGDEGDEGDEGSGDSVEPGPEQADLLVIPAEDPRAALLAGVEAGEAGKWGEALELFRAALAAAPTWSSAHMETAHALLMTGGDTGTIGQHLQQARLLDRDNARLHYLEGLLMEEMRQPAMAAAAYERAAEIRPSLLDARLRLGRLLLQEGHVADAITHLEASVRLEPSLLPARANLASAYEAAGRIDEAARQLEAIANLFPDNVFHLHRLAAFHQRHGREAEAKAVMRRADAIDPNLEQQNMRPLPPSRR